MYILQASLYQEIVFQNTGKKLPFIIAAMTKEKISERALLNIPKIDMDAKLEEIKEYIHRNYINLSDEKEKMLIFISILSLCMSD